VVVLTKGAGIEGTAVLATDFRALLEDAGVGDGVIDRAAGFFSDLSVIPEAAALAPVATAMHDPTEGGVLNGLVELACASGVQVELHGEMPVRPETNELCAAVGVDPLRVLGSGALLATVPKAEVAPTLETLDASGIEATVVGEVAEPTVSGPGVVHDGQHYSAGVRDEMYDLWE
jgi:hydrogenase expression/formation protein HypE